MKRSPFVFALRTLKKNRLCTCISILGLGLGLVCMIVIAKYVWQEYTTDQFHRNYDRIYACTSQASEKDRPALSEMFNSEKMMKDFPEIEACTEMGLLTEKDIIVKGQAVKAKVATVTPGWQDVFDFPLMTGDTTTLFHDEFRMLVTEHFARKAFGDKDPLGQYVSYWDQDYQIIGVLKDLPVNSSLHFDAVVPTRMAFSKMSVQFIVLKENASIEPVKKGVAHTKINDFQHYIFSFVPFRGLYFNRDVDTSILENRHGDPHALGILVLAAVLILLISMVNFMNMYQVTLLRREKELAVKKVHGVGGICLWTGFWLENLLMVLAAVLFAVLLILGFSGVIEKEIGVPLQLNLLFDFSLIVGMLLLLPVLTSVWPFLKIRRLSPAMAMKSKSGGRYIQSARRILLVGQYMMTLVMLIVAFYFIRQLHFMLDKELGIKQDRILHTMMFKEPAVERGTYYEDPKKRKEHWENIRNLLEKHEQDIQYVENEIQKNPNIRYACSGASLLDYQTFPWKLEGEGQEYESYAMVDGTPEYKELYGIKLKAGRFFDRTLDAGRESKVVINESAVKKLGIKNPEEALQAKITNNSWPGSWQIVGVMEDFRFNHLSSPVLPLVMIYFGDKDDCPYQLEVTAGKEQEVIAFLKKLHDEINPNAPFEYYFFEEKVRELYEGDRKIVNIATIFTVLAMLISSFGLFGFVYFDSRQRFREIGIRKVNGATTGEVMRHLVKNFLMLIVMAFVVACPIAFMVIRKYMENYSEYATLPWWLFVIAGFLTGMIAFLTLFGQSYKAANANPVEALRGNE